MLFSTMVNDSAHWPIAHNQTLDWRLRPEPHSAWKPTAHYKTMQTGPQHIIKSCMWINSHVHGDTPTTTWAHKHRQMTHRHMHVVTIYGIQYVSYSELFPHFGPAQGVRSCAMAHRAQVDYARWLKAQKRTLRHGPCHAISFKS
jgi:hypothetical protein